ncbi:MAG: class I SAM-dependent methyltransferase [Eubacterium sp.]|nr:class I SAM-dependent methyltransferase [Eubacterium sp.]
MQKLSKRLQAAADFVTEGSRVADIGTDHGFLPIYLVQSGKCQRVIAMDIKAGPLERAREHIAAAGLGSSIQTRLSDGLRELGESEADSAVIAGMGGLTVIHILEQGQKQLRQLKELVLEPQSDIAKVRRFLREHKLEIDRETIVQEAGKFYPMMHIPIRHTDGHTDIKKAGVVQENIPQAPDMRRMEPAAGYKILLERFGDAARVQEVLDQYGECLVFARRRHPVFMELLERDAKRELTILRELEKGQQGPQKLTTHNGRQPAAQRKTQVERRLEEIRALQELCMKKQEE